MTSGAIIDVWNPETYDQSVSHALRTNTVLIAAYFETERRIIAERDASDHRGIPQPNPHYQAFSDFLEDLSLILEAGQIRAWHYTRLTEIEVSQIKAKGVSLSTFDSLRMRLRQMVDIGAITNEMAESIISGSPLRDETQHKARAGRFWATSHPHSVDDSGVELLLRYWGGEVAYFWQDNRKILRALEGIGIPRVIELAIPIVVTKRAYLAARSIVSTFSKSLGIEGDFRGFDVCAYSPLGAEAIRAVHTEGNKSFETLGTMCGL